MTWKGASTTYRKGELTPAAIDRGWPHQVALPAAASLNGGYKASLYVSAVTRSSMKIDGGTCTASPNPDTPRSLCNGSVERNLIQSKGEREATGRDGKDERVIKTQILAYGSPPLGTASFHASSMVISFVPRIGSTTFGF
jgi:hypothetical protein